MFNFLRNVKTLCFFCLFFGVSTLSYASSAYSNKELDELEKEFVEQINNSNSVLRDPLANQYINNLGQRLAQHAPMPAPHFFIVKSNEINAFAGPGGYIGINSQLILATHNESELAGVMAHEMAHVRQHHLYRMLEHQKQMKVPMLASVLASIALGAINPILASGAVMATMSGFAQDQINYVRSNEKEADRIGMNMLIKSGINPKGMAIFFKTMQENSRYYYNNTPAILRTHPIDDARIAEAESKLAQLPNKSFNNNSLDYQLFKEIVRVDTSPNDKQLLDYYKTACKLQTSACKYGYTLALLELNRYQQAKNTITPLQKSDESNLFYTIAAAQADIGLKEFKKAVSLLKRLNTRLTNNYAVTINLANSLLADKQTQNAVDILLQASRTYKNDLKVCQQLSRAQALNKQKGYAYFTEAQCQLLQGRKRLAIHQLKTAKNFASNNKYLMARIDAKIDEIKADKL